MCSGDFTAVGHKEAAVGVCRCVCERVSSEPTKASLPASCYWSKHSFCCTHAHTFHLRGVCGCMGDSVCLFSVPEQPEILHHLGGFCMCGHASETCRGLRFKKQREQRKEYHQREREVEKMGWKKEGEKKRRKLLGCCSTKNNTSQSHSCIWPQWTGVCVCVRVWGGFIHWRELQPVAVCHSWERALSLQ